MSWQIDADITFNCLEHVPGSVPLSCSSQTWGPSCCHTLGLLLSPLSFLIRLCRHLMEPFESSGCPSNHIMLMRCCSWCFPIWVPAIGSPWALAFFRMKEMGPEVKIKGNIAKGGRNRWVAWMPLSFVHTITSGWNIWYYSISPTSEMGKARHRERKWPVWCLRVSQRRKEGQAETFSLLVQCSFSYTKLLFKIFMANSFQVVLSRDLRF